MGEVRQKFRPEFLNRLDDIILFHRLQRSEMGKIVDIQMQRLDKLLADRKIKVELDDAARTWLANRGYDPAYGARPLKRVIQRHVQDPLAEQILAGRIKDGDDGAHRRARRGAGAERRACEGGGLSGYLMREVRRRSDHNPGAACFFHRGSAERREVLSGSQRHAWRSL